MGDVLNVTGMREAVRLSRLEALKLQVCHE